LRGVVGMGTKEDESITGCVWAAGFHHVTARSTLGARFETYDPFICLIFQIFFSSRGKPRILNPRIRESACISYISPTTAWKITSGNTVCLSFHRQVRFSPSIRSTCYCNIYCPNCPYFARILCGQRKEKGKVVLCGPRRRMGERRYKFIHFWH